MINKLGSFVVFPKLEQQSLEVRSCFLETTVIHWLARWLIGNNITEYTKSEEKNPEDTCLHFNY